MVKDQPKQKPPLKLKRAIKRRKIMFSFDAKKANEVFLMGDFNNWNPETHPMKKDGSGTWGRMVLLPPGRYEYKFLVDGKWTLDPHNRNKIANCFGTYNSVLDVASK